jgi:glycine dehydrogenase subunit 1
LRYIPHTDQDRQAMLLALGLKEVDGLFEDIPENARLNRALNLPPALTEM